MKKKNSKDSKVFFDSKKSKNFIKEPVKTAVNLGLGIAALAVTSKVLKEL